MKYLLILPFLIFQFIGYSQKDTVDLQAEVIKKIISGNFTEMRLINKVSINCELSYDSFSRIADSQEYFDHTKMAAQSISLEEANKLKSLFIGDSIFKIPFDIRIVGGRYSINMYQVQINQVIIRDGSIGTTPVDTYNQYGKKVGISYVFDVPRISNCTIKNLVIIAKFSMANSDRTIGFILENSTIEDFNLGDAANDLLKINGCHFQKMLLSNINSDRIEIENNIIDISPYEKNQKIYNEYGDEVGTTGEWMWPEAKFIFGHANEVMFNKNQFLCTTPDSNQVDFELYNINLHGKVYDLQFLGNEFESGLNLNFLEVEKNFKSVDNQVGKIALNKFIFPELRNELYWSDFENFKISFLPSQILSDALNGKDYIGIDSASFMGNSPINRSTHRNFLQLIRVYQNMNEIFRRNGDKESANGCYAEMKQVETRRWKYLYHQNKSFESFFRWQLNAFLSYFTDYGTNPAKAVIKSAWVILLFSIFYLFFPSDWDITDRAKFLQKWKELLSSNAREKSKVESGKSSINFYLSTFYFLLFTTFIHILNALTLSLNAFTTLGFGDIPTHGAARYVTIVQGFIGWFLLTIFSVSLINQVLG